MRDMEIFRAFLAARDISENLLIAYSEEFQGNKRSVYRVEDVREKLHDLADRLGFQIVEKEAAE